MGTLQRRNRLAGHLREHASMYIFHTVLLVMGVIFGAVIVNSLSATQKQDLFYFINEFFVQMKNGEIVSAKEVFSHTLAYNSKFIGIIWLLGISMIGLPIILVMLFLKGMVVGFTVGFLVQQMGLSGFLLSVAAVLPQNFIALPVYIFVVVAAVAFSLQMIKKLFVKRFYQPFAPMLLRYILVYGAANLLLCAAAVIESYLTPLLMRAVLSLFHH